MKVIINESQYNIILFEDDNSNNIMLLIQNVNEHDIDFIEGESIGSNTAQIIITIKGKQIPIELVNFQITPREINGEVLYQPSIFISEKLQRNNLGYKIYVKFINEFGNLYSGFGRVMNKEAITRIYEKLNKTNGISVETIYNQNKISIGLKAFKN